MTRNELARRYPNASESFIQRNLGADYVDPAIPSAKPEPAIQHEVERSDASQKRGSGRFEVRITSYRVRLLDADNLAGGCKFLIDALRYEKLIPDDSPDAIELFISQVRVSKKLSERTEVIIIPIPGISGVEAAIVFKKYLAEDLKERNP